MTQRVCFEKKNFSNRYLYIHVQSTTVYRSQKGGSSPSTPPPSGQTRTVHQCSVADRKALPAETARWTLMTPKGNKPATVH